MMRRAVGKTVYGGIVMGPVLSLKRDDRKVVRTTVDDAKGELNRLAAAIKAAQEELQQLYDKALGEVGQEGAAVFEVHQMMLEDEDYLDAIHGIIEKEFVNAEYAVAVTGDNFSEMFAGMEDEYMNARAADVKDISDRLIKKLLGEEGFQPAELEPSILFADEITPSETVQMDKEKILAFVTTGGSANSHTSILARMMNIPALVGVKLDGDAITNGMTAVVDGYSGEFILEPTESVVEETKRRMQEEQEKQQLLQSFKGKESITQDGHRIKLFANIGGVSDLGYALENDAEGIGLMRSEFLYLGRDGFPTEEEQLLAYKQILQTMAGREVVIRTLDIGADKQADYFRLEKEENPALGFRAIRICLAQPEIFKVQLRALFRAAVFGQLSIMYPMITSAGEIRQIQAIAKEVKEELDKQQIPYQMPKQGIMIETPAAALVSDELAPLVDFFSIGTNDLTQYVLAIDRQNRRLEDFYDPHHPAILKLIRMVVKNAHKNGIWVGICGELGADTDLTEEFVRMGVDELSVSPPMLLKLRQVVRQMRFSKKE